MRTKLLSLLVSLPAMIPAFAQGLKIGPGTYLRTDTAAHIVLQNADLVNNGNSDFSKSNLHFSGNTTDSIGGSGTTTISKLYVDKKSSGIALAADINVVNSVTMQNGLLDLAGHNLLLSSSGILIGETEASRITGPSGGVVSITTSLNAPSGANPGNLGAIITSSQNLGSVVIQRGHASQTNNGTGKSILRYFNIQPTNNSSLNATFRFTYLDAELNGLTETSLGMWKSSTGGSKWSKVTASSQSTAGNYIEASGLNTLLRYTLSSSTFTFNSIAIAADEMITEKTAALAITPNPVSFQGYVTVTAAEAFNTRVSVFAADGRKMIEQPVQLRAGANTLNIDMHQLASGAYFLVVNMKDGSKKTIAFMKH